MGFIPRLALFGMRVYCAVFGTEAAKLALGRAMISDSVASDVIGVSVTVHCMSDDDDDEDESDLRGWIDDAAKGKGGKGA